MISTAPFPARGIGSLDNVKEFPNGLESNTRFFKPEVVGGLLEEPQPESSMIDKMNIPDSGLLENKYLYLVVRIIEKTPGS